MEQNLIDFLVNVLNGIEYGSISTTNRAYQWMKNNSSLHGPCITYLKNYVSPNNLVTQSEMALFLKLEAEGNLPNEDDIDKELEKYFENAEFNEFEFDDSQCYSNILRNADNYVKELNLADKFLRRKQNDLKFTIEVEKRREESNEREMEEALSQSDRMNISTNEIVNNIQFAFSNMLINFEKLLSNNVNPKEHNIFQINFEIFKQINSTFRNTVGIVMEKQFSAVKEHLSQNDSGKGDGPDDISNRRQFQTLVQVAHCFGERSFQNIKYQCEEAEFQKAYDFMSNLLQGLRSKEKSTVSCSQLQSQTAANLETVDEIQKKLSILSENLEKHYKNFMVHEIFSEERNCIEFKLKSDKKRLRKVSDLCSTFVDLLVLQAFLLENEKNNVDLAIDLYHKAVSILENHLNAHSHSVSSVERMLQKREGINSSHTDLLTKIGTDLLKIDPESHEKLDAQKILMKFSTANHDLLNETLTLADRKLNAIGILKNNLNRLDAVIFNGPARQPFFRGRLLADRRIIETQWAEFNKIFRSLKKDYKEELERLSSDEYVKLEKTLWITFLTDSQSFQDKLQKLREKAGINKTLIVKKIENLSSLATKSNRSSSY